MTTAHRPTFDPARGKEAQRGPAYHQRLLPAHTQLKVRKPGQGGAAGFGNRDLQAELLLAEKSAESLKIDSIPSDEKVGEDDEARSAKRKDIEDDAGSSDGDGEDPEAKRRRLILEEAKDIDADSDGSEASDEEEDEDEDEEAALLRELTKIKVERAAAKAAEEAAQAAREEEQREIDIARGNPLLIKQEFGVKRRWDDDVVFRNQARGTDERGRKKEFVNDLLRSDFHKKFMSKYVR